MPWQRLLLKNVQSSIAGPQLSSVIYSIVMCAHFSLAWAYPYNSFPQRKYGSCVNPILKINGSYFRNIRSNTATECLSTCPATACGFGKSKMQLMDADCSTSFLRQGWLWREIGNRPTQPWFWEWFVVECHLSSFSVVETNGIFQGNGPSHSSDVVQNNTLSTSFFLILLIYRQLFDIHNTCHQSQASLRWQVRISNSSSSAVSSMQHGSKERFIKHWDGLLFLHINHIWSRIVSKKQIDHIYEKLVKMIRESWIYTSLMYKHILVFFHWRMNVLKKQGVISVVFRKWVCL